MRSLSRSRSLAAAAFRPAEMNDAEVGFGLARRFRRRPFVAISLSFSRSLAGRLVKRLRHGALQVIRCRIRISESIDARACRRAH